MRTHFMPGYETLLDTLGIASSDALAGRARQLGELLPALSQVAGEIVAANPAIKE
jgi:hypothetical protein